MAIIIDGKSLASKIRNEIKREDKLTKYKSWVSSYICRK